MGERFDFSGWATKNDLRCSDGRTIRRNAFKDNDGLIVPLVWQHQHNEPENVLGHALLQNREEGVYTYGKFNDTPAGQTAKMLVEHGDINALSIYANGLVQKGGDVIHGAIREVSLVIAGANPGASIEFPVLSHGEESEDEAIIYTGDVVALMHEDDTEEVVDEVAETEEVEETEEPTAEEIAEEILEEIRHADDSADTKTEEKEDKKMADEKTIKDVVDSMTEEQRNIMYYLIAEAMGNKEGDTEMKHNVFENEVDNTDVLSHDAMTTILGDAKRYGSLKDSFLAHAEEYGIENIEYLFPDARTMTNAPEFIKREDSWVSKVMNGTHHTPFSRIKSVFADITEDEARAKGYIKGNLKKEEVFSLLKRTTTPTTIYKKQKLDRDDVIDITDFDVIAWLKTEMRMMLNEEIARAILIGDGRPSSSDDKINESNIRPIWKDEDLFTVKASHTLTGTPDTDAKAFMKACIRARKNYKGSGNPTLFTTEDMLTEMLLIEDSTGRAIYENASQLANKLRVKEIVTVEVMEGLTRTVDTATHALEGIIVNLSDYNVGADKGGAVNMFDDFDIDYNQQKYLIETRCSGALTKPFSALVIEGVQSNG